MSSEMMASISDWESDFWNRALMVLEKVFGESNGLEPEGQSITTVDFLLGAFHLLPL